MIDIINTFKFDSYLEIGVDAGNTFNKVKCKRKVGVDPNGNCATHRMPSDYFFAKNKETFDLVFIDGLHEWKQCLNDIINANRILTSCGMILVHDVNPKRYHNQTVPRESREWNGDVWKAWLAILDINPEAYTIDFDQGVGVTGKFKLPDPFVYMPIEWEEFVENKHKLLRLI